MKKALFTAIAVASLAILPATAQAVPIVGTLDLTGAVRVTPDSIDWLPRRRSGSGSHASSRRAPATSRRWANSLAARTGPGGVPVGVQLGLGIPSFETFAESPLPGLNFILDMIVSCGQASLNPRRLSASLGLDSPFRFDQDRKARRSS